MVFNWPIAVPHICFRVNGGEMAHFIPYKEQGFDAPSLASVYQEQS
jgi:hypothetical protein